MNQFATCNASLAKPARFIQVMPVKTGMFESFRVHPTTRVHQRTCDVFETLWPLTSDDFESIIYAFTSTTAVSPTNLIRSDKFQIFAKMPPLPPPWPPMMWYFVRSVYAFPLMQALSPSIYSPIGQTFKISTLFDLWPRNIFFTLLFLCKLCPIKFRPDQTNFKNFAKTPPPVTPELRQFLRSAKALPGPRAAPDQRLSPPATVFIAWIPENEIGYKNTSYMHPQVLTCKTC